MTELITSGMNPDVPPSNMAHKDFREAWLESIVRQALVDLVYIEGCQGKPEIARRRYLNLKDDLQDAIRKIDEADAQRKAVWEAKNNEAFTRRGLPPPFIGEGSGRMQTRDDLPIFLQK